MDDSAFLTQTLQRRVVWFFSV